MFTVFLAIPKMLENEETIDELLERIAENTDVMSMEVCACTTVWTAELKMSVVPTTFAVELALRFDGLNVRIID